jgi:hypothetical protein
MIQPKEISPPTDQAGSMVAFGQKIGSYAFPASYFLLGGLIVWGLLQPLDSTSVFIGDAQAQNLGWLLLACLVSWSRFASGRQQVMLGELLLLTLLGIWLLVVTLNASIYCNPRVGWNGFWHLIGLVGLYFSARELLSEPAVRSRVLVIIVACGIGLSVIGLHQVWIEFPQQRAEYDLAPEEMLGKLGLEAPLGSPQRSRFESRLYSPEPLATFALANSLAVFLSGALLILFGALASYFYDRTEKATISEARQQPRKPPKSKKNRSGKQDFAVRHSIDWRLLVLLLAIALIGCVWILTRSRIAYLSVFAAFVFWGIARWLSPSRPATSDLPDRRKLQRLLAIAGILIGFGLGGLAWLALREGDLLSGALQSVAFRAEYWTATWRMIGDHGALGVGLGNFQSYYPRYMLPTASETIADPHNWILDLAATCSIPFAVVITIGILKLSLGSWRPHGEWGSPQASRSARNLIWGAIAGLLAVAATLNVFGMPMGIPLSAFLVGGLFAWCLLPNLERILANSTFCVTLAAVSMLLCLLVSGSWQASGIVVPLICLLCCQLPLDRSCGTQPWKSALYRLFGPKTSPSAEGLTSLRGGPMWVKLAPSGIWLLVLVAFLWQSWNPVLLSSAAVMRQNSGLASQLEAVEAARRLDPLEAQWDRFRIELLGQQVAQSTNPERVMVLSEQVLESLQEWTKREPISFLTWQFAGERCLNLAAAASRHGQPDQRYLREADRFFREAVRAFPTSIQLRIQSALSSALVNDWEFARDQVEVALKLDRITPHMDRKMASQMVWVPQDLEGIPQIDRMDASWSRAELVVNWIRSKP